MLIKDNVKNNFQGIIYSKEHTFFRIFALGNDHIKLALYNEYDDVFRVEHDMEKSDNGFFELLVDGDLDGMFYTYLVGDREVTDPNSIAVSVNSQKSAIVDLEATNPEGFKNHIIPKNRWEEAILYEVHMADFTANQNSGVKHRGKFLGMAEENTFYNNVSTGLDHLQDLGVTHVHLLPVYDFISVDEKKDIASHPNNYNWGYDPELYNCLEGSYSTDPYDPKKRIYEFKYLVKSLHERGMSVVLDVVYNHTYKTKDSNFNILAPNYYHRNNRGRFQNGSGCGNEFSSEKDVAREFLINSLVYWVEEYKVDGFRFDLMALIDIDTIKLAISKLRQINPNIIIYGEPWMANTSLLPRDKQITIGAQKGENFSIFNPFYRDSLRGDNDGTKPGYVQGDFRYKPDIQRGLIGSISYDGTYSNFNHPIESINYFNAHDNLIFQDKLVKSGVPSNMHERMTIFTFSLLMMSQGIPFFHAGNEFLRDKKLDHNSYRSGIDVNGINWSLKSKHLKVYNVVKDLIKFRKEVGIFNLRTREEVIDKVTLIGGLSGSKIAYFISDDEDTYLIVHNASTRAYELTIKNEMINEINLIWANGFENQIVSKVVVEGLTSNVYKIRGHINEL